MYQEYIIVTKLLDVEHKKPLCLSIWNTAEKTNIEHEIITSGKGKDLDVTFGTHNISIDLIVKSGAITGIES